MSNSGLGTVLEIVLLSYRARERDADNGLSCKLEPGKVAYFGNKGIYVV
ncbi:hypothetical protein VCR29J2_180001 [Vibrio coralliirubri]|nr:hypothetical protein VCR29J2_180001 [Vibrio coralliirubri]